MSRLFGVVVTLGGVAALVPPSVLSQAAPANEGSVPPSADAPPQYETVFDELYGLAPVADRIAPVSGLVLERDVGTFTLRSGTLALLSPVAGQTVAALFVGDGVFRFAPPTRVEQEQMQRIFEQDHVEEPFRTLFILFTDSTREELEHRLDFAGGDPLSSASGVIAGALERLGDRKRRSFDADVMRTLLNGDRSGLFQAQVWGRGKPLLFEVNPYEAEEVRLYREADAPGSGRYFEVLSQFPRRERLEGTRTAYDTRDAIRIEHYRIESTIARNLDFSATAELTITAREADRHWIALRLYPELNVDSVSWDGTAGTFFRAEEDPTLWVRSGGPWPAGETRRLAVHYRGEVFERFREWLFIKSSASWYPRLLNRDRATFDLTFHTPEWYAFASVGDRMSLEKRDKVLTTRWTTPDPIRNAAFNLGNFDERKVEDSRIPPVTLLISESARREISRVLGRSRGMSRQVEQDMVQSLVLFQSLFGELPVKHFYATEIPYSHGEAFPGLVHLSWSTFQWYTKDGEHEVFRAHEVAHQWWGIAVDFATYHDQWLSEGLSQFSGLWYMQTALGSNDKYFDLLRGWRQSLMDNRRNLFGTDRKPGPVWLGYRNATSETEDDYGLIVYLKGAWIFHMLRIAMIDLQTMNEDPFTRMLRDFYSTYQGKYATTEGFLEIVERHAGIDMDWFFDQWVYGTAIPTYHVSYESTPRPDGKYRLVLRVRQENVPDDFRALVPVLVDFGDQRTARVKVWVTGATSEIELPIMPLEPKRVTFNYLEGVLADVKYGK